jgi:hypothetical protein
MHLFSINWEATGVIVNSFVALGTLSAVIVSLWTTKVHVTPKAKMFIKIRINPLDNNITIKLTNKRIVPIRIIEKGFYFKSGNFFSKKEKIFIVRNNAVNKKIEISDSIYESVFERELNGLLLNKGYTPKDKVAIYGYFLSSTHKLYKIKFFHIVKEKESYYLKLNNKNKNDE